jgi:HD-GYP domain-containing protein (c-di-GMP phosphodiesterase class II)
MNNTFYPLPTEAIIQGQKLPFSVYLKSSPTPYILYVNTGEIFSSLNYQELSKNKIKTVYIIKNDRETQIKYLVDSLDNVLHHSTLQSIEKVAIINNVAQQILIEALEKPTPENIRQCEIAASAQVELILSEPNTLLHVLKISKYDYYTYSHSVNVGFMLVAVLHKIYPEISIQKLNEYGLGALLHDIGKTSINIELLNKKGKLTDDEFNEIKKHPTMGEKIVKTAYLNLPYTAMSIILQHHENLDGSGYPKGLNKDVLDPASRLVRIIDIYDALTTNRPYKSAMKPIEAVILMTKEFSTKIDHKLLVQFIKLVTDN